MQSAKARKQMQAGGGTPTAETRKQLAEELGFS